ncbi:SMP-30/gluconolactonase/LRE family protein [Paenibacillus sp. UNC451MF]|uniref:SMP-30/gluconolactonase/LRE family protein n=1 Tax=Paenibacillus sp. UNC451MF TaxID=1449063 RepID=UPI00055A7AA9|nr:SMP-30/gluconolactonase/LRE family protein [Paenibacillus sp. UNC451MF]
MEKRTDGLQVALKRSTLLGEGAVWDAVASLLYWIDILGHKVFIFNPVTGMNREIDVGQPVGAVVPRASGGLLLAMKDGFFALDTKLELLTPLFNPESHLGANRFNDGKCDPGGRFWAGTMTNDSGPGGALYRLDTDMSVTQVLTGITCSNGITWSPDKKNMYYIDSPTREVWSFDYDEASANISGHRTAVTIPKAEGVPDGMTIDEEGMIWVAHWGGGIVSRWNPHSGDRLDTVHVPVTHVTSCAFGGTNLDTLYITTASVELNESERAKHPLAGSLFQIETKTRGIPAFSFRA